MFQYNSRHKVITGIALLVWAVWHFLVRPPAAERYPNGQVKSSGGQVDNLNQGLWTWYHENGRKRMEGRFDRGKREGLWLLFSPNGDTLHKAWYSADCLNGPSTDYGPGNVVLRTVIYKNDRAVDSLPAGR
ncbi:MAG: hypothetical protein KJZ58_08990 [Flavobacteriales bacterium]|nr:hypothetical protein [Flavobacteriales bacterium]MCL4282391.1 hypothetical protein [Flavobacteriales bacterium]